MSTNEWLTIIAIITGPIAAVLITLWRDHRNEAKRRRAEIFAVLIRTRKERLSIEHVRALNLIQLEFHGRQPIIAAYTRYIDHLNKPPLSEKEQASFDKQAQDLFWDLLATIATDLNYKFDKRDLERFSYMPQAWGDSEGLQRSNMVLLSELLRGKRSLRVKSESPQERDPFPPPPE